MDLIAAYAAPSSDDDDDGDGGGDGGGAVLEARVLSGGGAGLMGVGSSSLGAATAAAAAAAAAAERAAAAAAAAAAGVNLPLALVAAPPSALALSGGRAAPAAGGGTRLATGATVVSDSMDPAAFAAQHNAYSATGFAADPSGAGRVVGGGAARLASRAGSAAAAALGAPTTKRARAHNDDAADADGFLGPWAGFEGESEHRESALALGQLTARQKQLRVDLGLNPDAPGKLEGDALAAARARVAAEVAAEAAAAAAGGGGGGGGGAGGDGGAGAGAGAGAPPRKAARTDGAAAGAAGAAGAGAAAPPPPVAAALPPAEGGGGRGILSPAECKSTFHGREAVDYQGRAWCAVPKGVRPDGGEHECFVPKRAAHTWAGHGKGVSSVHFAPGTGHLLLTAAFDGKAKVWDVAGNRALRRTYAGHTAGVRQARFAPSAAAFATVSFDKSAKAWDTETGACTASWAPGDTPLCVAWAPGQGERVLLVGTKNKKVVQYDTRAPPPPPAAGGGGGGGGGGASAGAGAGVGAGAPALEYDYHLGPVNALTFFDGGRRFISAGDDKLLVWDLNTPVPIKHIADPSQHAITAAALHPDGTSWVGQCMDNSLPVFSLGDRIARNAKKTFKGHVGAGYACQPAFSPDGRFLGSGDGEGFAFFWDWRSHRVLAKIRAHEGGPCVGMDWHPLNPSWVATCGMDGVAKLWD